MDGMHSFFAMGGYAAFVWPAYLLVVAVMAGLFLTSRRDLKRREREVQSLKAMAPERRGDARRGEGA
jgi:heme exporter protein D